MTTRFISITTGSRALVAAPSEPLPENITNALARVVENYPDVLEAHLPLCFIQGAMQEPAQVLVLIHESFVCFEPIAKSIGVRLLKILPSNMDLLTLPIERTNAFCHTVRGTKCQIYGQGYKPQ